MVGNKPSGGMISLSYLFIFYSYAHIYGEQKTFKDLQFSTTNNEFIKQVLCVCVCLCALPVRQYGYAFQAFSWMLRAEAGANIRTNDGTLLQDSEVNKPSEFNGNFLFYCYCLFLL